MLVNKSNPVKKILTISGSSSGEVSYRMIANRHDWMNWPTIIPDGPVSDADALKEKK